MKRPAAPAKPIVKRAPLPGAPSDEDTAPQLPHEADQSSSHQHSESPQQAKIGRQAKADLERGLVDTGRSPVVDKLNREHFAPAPEARPSRKPPA
ncbi:MAG: hypothetical protein ABI434_00525 [Burkholderiaceae bacterium]